MSQTGAPEGNLPPRKLSFGRYVVDLGRGCLLSDGREIALRPKTFAVLTYLAERPGHLVSKEELLDAVWPGLIVTDDTVVQSIGELRRALGDSESSLITTVPKRGYRLDTDAAPPERRHQPGLKNALRWRWMYGLIAPLLLFLAFVLIWFITSRHPPREAATAITPAVAVLPFQNQGADTSRDYFTDGITQDLIQSLGRFRQLTVMSWNAVAIYKGAVAQPGEIARVLNVRYQVEGSVRHDADRVRISAQLVDVEGRVLWSGRFDEAALNQFDLLDRITREIAGALAVRVEQLEAKRAAAKSRNLEAYDLVLRARPLLRQPTRAGLAEARSMLRQALAMDREYAQAHAALGETFHAALSMGWAEAPQEYWQRVTSHANEALRLDPDNVRALVLLGRMHMTFNRYTEAEIDIRRAIEINPNDSDGLAGYGNVLLWRGRIKQSIESLELARRIDPGLNAYDRFALGLAYYLDGRYVESIEEGEINLRQSPEATFNLAVLAAAYAQEGRMAEATHAADELRRRDPTFNSLLFGTKFQDTRDLERLRQGLEKAGIYSR